MTETKLKLIPVLGNNNEIQLYDMYIEGEWHGSKRTEDHCKFWYEQYTKPLGFEPPAKPMEEHIFIVDCTVCGKKVYTNNLDPGTKWHGCLTKEDSHHFEYGKRS